MHALRQKCRPKHQVLVLNCYPRHQKNNVEVKPNSSELSYLLYYASTRRSKLQKVGDFLQKRTENDVYYIRNGYVESSMPNNYAYLSTNFYQSNVQVTLQILKALIEKTPRDLPLYAAATLRIFKCILKSQDVTMIEDSVPTFAAFCTHQDPVILAANQGYVSQYQEVVHLYASFASKENPPQQKAARSVPIRIRFRKAGLAAIKAIAQSETMAAETAKQLAMIVPAILENIYSEDGQYLLQLEQFEGHKAELERDVLSLKRRQSASIPTPVTVEVPDPIAAAGSTEAADALAERETGFLALQALRQIFAVVPQSQLRLATAQVLRFMGDRINPRDHFPASTIIPLQSGSWPCRLMSMICSWAPVGDRHGILITAVEELVESPLREEDFEKQYVLATITGWLLSSEINFIGLSVMDVLVGLLQHIMNLLHGSVVASGAGTPKEVENENDTDETKDDNPEVEHEQFESTYVHPGSKAQLLVQLQRCIGCLAVHVYYSDQVGDMISAILSRLKTPSVPPVAENGGIISENAASTTSLPRRKSLDDHFVSNRAKITALRSIKEIIIWANWTKVDGTSSSSTRHAISIERWDGTQWLLRDECWAVRLAYVDVLLVWMNYELKKSSLRVLEPAKRKGSKKEKDKKDSATKEPSLARRAVSNASHREKSPPRLRTSFMPLLHLAIHDNVIQYATSENDILLLHLLLYTLVAKLGVNSAQFGLPMIRHLQGDLNETEDPISKIHIGSLIQGYFWTLSSCFHFDASATGREISFEVSERIKKGIWLHTLRIPPIPLEEVAQKMTSKLEPPPVESISFQPFTKFPVMVEKMAQGYEVTLYSPPASPPTSPMRKLSTPLLEQSASILSNGPSNYLSTHVKETLLSEWDRETILAHHAPQEGSRSGSLSGTSPTNGSGNKHLSVGIAPFAPGSNGDLLPSPRRSMYGHGHHHHHHTASPYRGSRPVSAAQGARDAQYLPHTLRDTLLMTSRARNSHTESPYATTSSARSAIRVEDLKRVLSGTAPSAIATATALEEPEDSASESMMSYEGSEYSTAQSQPDKSSAEAERATTKEASIGDDSAIQVQNGTGSEGSMTPRPLTAASLNSGRPPSRARSNSSPSPEREKDEIPPVPPVPENYASMSPPRSSATSSNYRKSSPPPFSSPPRSPGSTPRFKPMMNSATTNSATKEESIRSQAVRQDLRRSISTRDGTGSILPAFGGSDTLPPKHQQKSGWNALDLLESIETDGPSPPPGSSTNKPLGGRMKPPY
jgi:protein EFR3